MNLKSAIECILFLRGEAVTTARLAKLSGAPKKTVETTLHELQDECRERGIVLIQNGDEWQFVTNPAQKSVVEKLATSELREELSRAGLEVLTIVAYKGPISRASIEYLRGVDSSFTLRNLLIRGLVIREENPKDRRSYLYRISADFLAYLGLVRPADLPHYQELRRVPTDVPLKPEST